jgi:hypothetical protein
MTDYDKMYTIVGIAMQLYNELGYGLAEPIYKNACPYSVQKKVSHGNARNHWKCISMVST